MASLRTILLCSLSLIVSPFVNATYERWTALPYCAQGCFTKAVNDSLATCAHVSLDCFCRNTVAAKEFDLCLQANVPCNSNPINHDVEVFKNTVFCNTSVDSGFDYTAAMGAATATLGTPSGESLSSTMSSIFPSTIHPTNTSTICPDSDSAQTTFQGLITSTSTVVVELSSTASSSGKLNGTWTASAFPTVIAAQSFNGAPRACVWDFGVFGTGFLMTWILVGKIF
ncbi:CFEM domain-containing protein [Cladophialophora immunda]|nr:CFEM domain-containing protein [Cladophialophora immunda]